MKKLTRPIGLKMLKWVSARVLDKHQPTLIIVTGTGETSVIRETLYTSLKDYYPTRRNLEKPEAEFSIPLTVFGSFRYPESTIEWILITLKTLIQLVYIKPHKHILIIEINPSNKTILNDWINALSPNYIITTSEMDLNATQNTTIKTIIWDKKDARKDLARFVSTIFDIDYEEILQKIEDDTLPASKINFAQNEKGNVVIDATFYHMPPALDTIEEILAAFPGSKKLIGELPEKWKSHHLFKTMAKIPTLNETKKDDVVLLIGYRPNLREIRHKLRI